MEDYKTLVWCLPGAEQGTLTVRDKGAIASVVLDRDEMIATRDALNVAIDRMKVDREDGIRYNG